MNIHSCARTCPASRALLVRRVSQEGWSVGRAAEAAGVSARTGYKWCARYRDEGVEGLLDRSCRPHRSPTQVPHGWQQTVLELRRLRMTGARIAARLGLPRSTVARILKRHGLGRLKNLEPPIPIQRYERRRAGELVHLDVKKLGRFRAVGHRITGVRTHVGGGLGWEFVHVCIDDYSRLAYVEILENEKGTTTAGFLRRAADWFGERGVRIRRVMSDNGPNYLSGDFARAVLQVRARHIRTRPYTPRTNGKAERFIQTLLREWAYARPYLSSAHRSRALPTWVRRYNERRPHGGIGAVAPITRLPRAA